MTPKWPDKVWASLTGTSSFTKGFNLFVRYHPSFYSCMVSPKIHYSELTFFQYPSQNITRHNLCCKVIFKINWYRLMTALVMTTWLLNRCWLWRNPNDNRDRTDFTVVLHYFVCSFISCSIIIPSESSNIIFAAWRRRALIVSELWQGHTRWTRRCKTWCFCILIAIRWIFASINI